MTRFKIIIMLVDNGERVSFGFADPDGNFYPFYYTDISNFDLAFFCKQLIQEFTYALAYDNFDTAYVKYQIEESDEIILEEFVFI